MRSGAGAYAFIVAGMLSMVTPVMADEPLPRAQARGCRHVVGAPGARSPRRSTPTSSAAASRARWIAVARKGKLVYFEAFGYRDKAAGVTMTTDTIFNIASMTKPMTAVGALMLYEQGRICRSTIRSRSICRNSPRMKVAVLDASGDAITDTAPAKRPITIHDLMTHTSGPHLRRPRHDGGAQALSGRQRRRRDEPDRPGIPRQARRAAAAVAARHGVGLRLRPRRARPGGRAGRRAVARRLPQERLWKPLGMVDTGFVIPPEKAARYAKALPNDPDTGKPQKVEPDLHQADRNSNAAAAAPRRPRATTCALP